MGRLEKLQYLISIRIFRNIVHPLKVKQQYREFAKATQSAKMRESTFTIILIPKTTIFIYFTFNVHRSNEKLELIILI